MWTYGSVYYRVVLPRSLYLGYSNQKSTSAEAQVLVWMQWTENHLKGVTLWCNYNMLTSSILHIHIVPEGAMNANWGQWIISSTNYRINHLVEIFVE